MQMDELFGRQPDDHEDADDVDDDDDTGEATPEGFNHRAGGPAQNGGGVGSVGGHGHGHGHGGGFGDAMDQAGQSMELEPRSFSRGGQRGYEPAPCDMPNEEDIASSVPIDITFMDPAAMHWGNGTGNGNASAGAAAALAGSASSGDGTDSAHDRQGEFGNVGVGGTGGVGAAGSSTTGVAGTGGGGGAGCSGSSMGGGTPVALAQRKVGLDSFKIVRVIGKGSFGKVFLVREKVAGDIYAMKVLRKDNIIKRNQVEHTKTERNVLG
ncbi:unnamed protein product [Hapterophycus canaliculatus]